MVMQNWPTYESRRYEVEIRKPMSAFHFATERGKLGYEKNRHDFTS